MVALDAMLGVSVRNLSDRKEGKFRSGEVFRVESRVHYVFEHTFSGRPSEAILKVSSVDGNVEVYRNGPESVTVQQDLHGQCRFLKASSGEAKW